MRQLAQELIKDHEGFRDTAYLCPAGKWTAGWGHNLEAHGIVERGPFTLDQCRQWLREDIDASIADLETFDWWDGLSDVRKAALVDFRFNVGPGTMRQFKRMLAAIAGKDFDSAAEELLDSKYARQTGRRARKIAAMLVNG